MTTTIDNNPHTCFHVGWGDLIESYFSSWRCKCFGSNFNTMRLKINYNFFKSKSTVARQMERHASTHTIMALCCVGSREVHPSLWRHNHRHSTHTPRRGAGVLSFWRWKWYHFDVKKRTWSGTYINRLEETGKKIELDCQNDLECLTIVDLNWKIT